MPNVYVIVGGTDQKSWPTLLDDTVEAGDFIVSINLITDMPSIRVRRFLTPTNNPSTLESLEWVL